MDSDQIFWGRIWTTVVAGICFVVGVGVGNDMYATQAIERMVAAGADPISAKCAISGWGGSGGASAVCALAIKR